MACGAARAVAASLPSPHVHLPRPLRRAPRGPSRPSVGAGCAPSTRPRRAASWSTTPPAPAALIGRLDRRGRLLWSLPKGHIEAGETAEQAAVREVEEETGIIGRVVAPLGTIDFWFVAEDRRVHKTVHHFLLRALGGELSDDDVEVAEVAWVPLDELESRLAYADERRLIRRATELLEETRVTRRGRATRPLAITRRCMLRSRRCSRWRPAAHRHRPRPTPAHRPAPAASGPLTAASSPSSTPRVVTAAGPPTVTVAGIAHQHRRPARSTSWRSGCSAASRCAPRATCATRWTATAGTDAVTPRVRPAARRAGPGRLAAGPARRAAARRPDRRPRAGPARGATSCSSTSTGCRGTGRAPGWPRRGCCCRCCRCRPVRSRATSRSVPTVPPDVAGLTVLYPMADTPHRLPTVPGEPTLLTDDELATVAGAATAGSAGWSRRSPRRRRRVRPSATPPAWPSIRTSSRRPRRCGRATRCVGPDRHGAGHRRRGRRHLAGRAGRGRPRRLRRRAALRRRRPRRARPRAARRPGRHGRRRRGRGGHRGPRHAGAGGHHVAQRRSARRAGARHRRRGPAPARWCSTPEPWTAVRRGRPAGRSRSPSARRRCSRCSPTRCWPARPRHRTPPPALSPVPSTTVPAAASPPLATQDAVATLVFRCPGLPERRSRSSLAPPHVWGTDATGARALLAAVDLLLDSGRMQASGLADVVAAGPTTPGGGPAPGRPAAGRQPRHPARGAGVRPRDARRRARPALGRRARHRGRRHGRRDVRPAACRPRCAPPRPPGTAGRTSPARRRRRRRPGSGSCATRSACSPRPARTRWGRPTRRCC